MGSEQHRRLIGNDVVVIIFKESGSLDISDIGLGTVPQVYLVVQPIPKSSNFRVAAFSRVNVKPFGPDIPQNPIEATSLKDYILTKGIENVILCQNSHDWSKKKKSGKLTTVILRHWTARL